MPSLRIAESGVTAKTNVQLVQTGFDDASPSLTSRSNGARPLHISLICDTFEPCGTHFLGEVICRNYAGPALGRWAPCDGPRQPPKVIARLCLISPRLDLFITDVAPVKKMLIHGSTVYEDLHSTLLGIGSGSRIPMLTVV